MTDELTTRAVEALERACERVEQATHRLEQVTSTMLEDHQEHVELREAIDAARLQLESLPCQRAVS